MKFETRHTRLIAAMWTSMLAHAVVVTGATIEVAIPGIGRSAEPRRIAEAWNDEKTFWLSDIGSLFMVVSLLALLVMFMRWYYRAVLLMQGQPGFRWTPKWSIAYWIIPIGNLFRPYQVMQDLMLHHDHSVNQQATRHRKSWWAAWIISNLGSNVRLDSPVLDILGGVGWLVAGYYFIPIFKAIAHADDPQMQPSRTAEVFD